jgi:alpha-ketoglutarate-dependent taurine dioxygenase
LESGAILFRGFEVQSRDEFLQVKKELVGDSNFNYVDGNSPRIKVSSYVYTSTEFPPDKIITLHNELSYTSRWPSKIFFYCEIPAVEGGETPIIDCRYVLDKLDQKLIDAFKQHGVKYTRYLNGGQGFGKNWMDTFETDDKKTVEKYCDDNEIEYSWNDNSIFISQQGLGIATHPVTHEKVWFNQADQFHPSSLPADVYETFNMLFKDEKHKYPQYAYYGNGEEIPENYLKEITHVLLNNSIKFKWEKGDILMLDNMLMAHGRMPFKGERKVYVSMA